MGPWLLLSWWSFVRPRVVGGGWGTAAHGLASCPCIVTAQMTATPIAMVVRLQIGEYGMKRKLERMLIPATMTATVRGQMAPRRRDRPAAATRTPMRRWIQPHAVWSNSNT